jgi:phosphate starvation-inducible PhoH-like protein
LENDLEAKMLLGKHDENIRFIEKELGVKTVARAQDLTVSGNEKNVKKASKLIEELLFTIRKGGSIRRHDITYVMKAIKKDPGEEVHDIFLDRIDVMSKRTYVTPKTKGQKEYVDSIRRNDIVFGIGPAGTGKTYLAMAMAVNALKKQIVSRIILTRPALEAGESLGFLPGDLHEKIGPYLRPLYDALYDMVDPERIQHYTESGVIEVVPIAYMRGRTLNNAFVVLDEAQNCTPEQMKMFLTRIGFDSKAVITGDITQSDLPKGHESGLKQAVELLSNIEGIRFMYLKHQDMVRHELVQEIIRAYDRHKK